MRTRFVLFVINVAGSSVNAGLYAATGNPVSIAIAVCAGFIALGLLGALIVEASE